jgi:hypothetical protein
VSIETQIKLPHEQKAAIISLFPSRVECEFPEKLGFGSPSWIYRVQPHIALRVAI